MTAPTNVWPSGRRRKEHMKNLEQAQKEQSTEQSDEIERLRSENAELRKENDMLRAQLFNPSYSQSTATTRAPQQQQDAAAYSPTSSRIDSVSTTGSPPPSQRSELMPMSSLSLTSSISSPSSLMAYADPISLSMSQPYTMVPSSGPKLAAQNSPESPDFGSPQSGLEPSFQPVTITQTVESQVSGLPAQRGSNAPPK